MIIRILYQYIFISKQEYVKIQKIFKEGFLKNKFQKFLGLIRRKQLIIVKRLQYQDVKRIWKQTVGHNFIQIWQFLARQKIYNKQIIQLFESSECYIKTYSLMQYQEIRNYYEQIIRFLRNDKQDYKINGNLDIGALYNEKIDRFISQKSLFLDKQKLNLAYEQIKNIISTLQIQRDESKWNQKYIYDIYGSIKTGFALIGQSDVDISINPNRGYLNRDMKIRYLMGFYNSFLKNPLQIRYISIDHYTQQKIRIPFIKIKFNSSFRQNSYILKSADIVIDSQQGVDNSKILELYSKSQFIIKFVNLLKYWARRKCIINKKMPSEGLSSYGVSLMVIFYLIKTNQAPYIIQKNNNYCLGKNLMPQRNYRSLYDNFKGFLQFYKKNGIFFTEQMTVCLIQKQFLSRQDKFIFNMFDFIDNSNPGRLNKKYSQKIFKIIDETYEKLKNYADLRNIMRYQQ